MREWRRPRVFGDRVVPEGTGGKFFNVGKGGVVRDRGDGTK